MVLLSGLSWEKFSLGASFINLAVGGARTFYYHQLSYRVTIESFFLRHMDKIHSMLKGNPLSVSVDVRYDSPGMFVYVV